MYYLLLNADNEKTFVSNVKTDKHVVKVLSVPNGA